MESERLFKIEYPFLSSKAFYSISYNKLDQGRIPLRMEAPLFKATRRCIDIMVSVLVIALILSWLTPILALLIKSDSSGPVFFLQRRNGKNKKIFTCIKFRSMVVNKDADLRPVKESDSRITQIGKLLRKYCIDELPQFINVLRGDMTIVGPRPYMISENTLYEKLITNYAFRYYVKPGITGLGQLSGFSSEDHLQKMNRRTFWDIFYIHNWSPALDLHIVYQTLVLCFVLNKRHDS